MIAGGHLSPGHSLPHSEPEIASLLPTLTQKQVLVPIVLTGKGVGVGMGYTTAQPTSSPLRL